MSDECVCHEQVITPCSWCIAQQALADLASRLAAVEHNEAEIRKHLACRIKAADDAHRRAFAAEDELDAARERERRLREALQDAWTDIGQWLQLARYQREQLDHDKTPCPTLAGIERSEYVRQGISAALAMPSASNHSETPNSSPTPAPLAWSSEPPKLPGLYTRRLGEAYATHRLDSENVAYASHWYPADAWFGPLPEPAEPGEVEGE